MAYIRSKKKRRKYYFYIVEGAKNKEGKYRQKIIKYLGTAENILLKYQFWEENH